MLNLPSPEKIELNIQYTLTLSINHKITSLKSIVSSYLRKIRDYIMPYAKFTVYPELSAKGRLHYHGWIVFESLESVFYFYKNIYGTTNIHVEIDTIADQNKWTEYITKSAKFKFIFDELLLPYTLKST